MPEKNISKLVIANPVIFLSLIGWSLFAYLNMMNMIREESIYAEIINLSGKQRMLSQNTALMTTRAFLQGECDLSDHKNKLVVVMEEEHDYILTRVHTERMKEIHRDLDPHVRAYLALFRIRPESDPSG